MRRRDARTRSLAVIAALIAVAGSIQSGSATGGDAGSGGDAGDTFETATLIQPHGRYEGTLRRALGDSHDWLKFHVPENGSLSVLVSPNLGTIDPVTLYDPTGTPVDVGTRVGGLGVATAPGFATGIYGNEVGALRLAIHHAAVAGEYRLHLRAEQFDLRFWDLCFMNCEQPQKAPIEMIFGGSLRQTDTRVLLIPPTHGDLGNPAGPTVLDYLDATLRGISNWTEALSDFGDAYPQFAYLKQITFDVEIFDGVTPVDPAGYDVVLGYVATGPSFRGVATNFVEITGNPRFSGRGILLSLYASSPRAGQVLYDFPEINDLEMVTMHEFGHTFGLGHTTTIHETLGFDVMNSPASFVYGDGSPIGAGAERTPFTCLSSLDLYGMAHLYRWIPSGNPVGSSGFVHLPAWMPYETFCPDHV